MSVQVIIDTPGRGLIEITRQIQQAVSDLGVDAGVCCVFMQHTSASLTIQENADPSARRDLEVWLDRTVRDDDPAWTHVSEGPDDMPSHVRSMLTDVSLTIPVVHGQLALGTWQGIYVCEHRMRPHRRSLIVMVTPAASPTQ